MWMIMRMRSRWRKRRRRGGGRKYATTIKQTEIKPAC